MKFLQTLKLTAASLAIASVVGCATTGGSDRPQVTLVDPATVPKENWSDALVMFNNQMGIYGMQDASADSTHGTAAGLVNDSLRQGYGAEMGVLAQSVAAGALFFVLDSGPANRMISRLQIAYWVPAEDVSSAEEASQVVAKQWTAVRKNVLAGRREVNQDQIAVSGYPISHPKAFGSIKQELNNERPPFAEGAKQQRVGGKEGLFYGPIFVHPGSTFNMDVGATRQSAKSLIEQYASHMPDTAMIYYPGESAPKIYEPAFVVNGQQKHTFKVEN